MAKANAVGPVSNGAEETISLSQPWHAKVVIEGVAPMLFHRWLVESVEAKSKAAKGSKAKKTDDVESYVWRNDRGELCLPGEYLRQSIIAAAKFIQDPRSPRKAAVDLFKAGIVCLTELASLGVKDWDRIDQRRVQVHRNGITRSRPCMEAGWRATIEFQVLLPEYITPELFGQALGNAGRLIGVGDFRPTYGRFQIIEFKH